MNQRHFGAKRGSRRHSTASFSENVVVAGISYPKEATSFTINNRTNVFGEKE